MANAIEKIVVHHDHQGESTIINLPPATVNGMPVTKEQHDLKQNIMTVAPGSTSMLTIDPNTSEIALTSVAITKVHVDTTATSIEDFVTNEYTAGNEFQEGDLIILTQAASVQSRNWIHNGGTATTSADFTRIQGDLVAADVRAFFDATAPLAFDAGTGKYSITFGTTTGKLGAHAIPVDSSLFSTIVQSDTQGALVALEDLIESNETALINLNSSLASRLDGLIGNGATATSLGSFTGTKKYLANSSLKDALQKQVDFNDEFVAEDLRQQQVLGGNSSENHLGAFTGTTFPTNASVKAVLQASETAQEAEVAARQAAISNLQNTLNTDLGNTDAAVALRTKMYTTTVSLTANVSLQVAHSFPNGRIVGVKDSSGNVIRPATLETTSTITLTSEVDVANAIVTIIGY